ncbi:MAG: hypothetical protein JWQ72_3984, partial [Polaromonas sp.]|nr:hypothetical protein [Polaromonas sp.]
IYAFERFGRQGLPKLGKHILWMFDPLTANPAATMHRHKTELFEAIAPQLHAVLAMDASIGQHVRQRFPELPVFRLPYLIAERLICQPLPEPSRERGIIMLGGDSPHRRQAERVFKAAAGPAAKAEFIWRGMWGKARDGYRAGSRISLNIHADPAHTYFDQFRTFETWAMGTAVVSETCADLEAFGIEPGVHLAMGALPDLPAACEALMADVKRREAMVAAAQALLRARFTVPAWQATMVDILHQVA